MNESLNIKKLCDILKESLPCRKFKVIGEVSQPKVSQGHLYLTLKDNSATIKAIIWKTKYEKIKTNLSDGDKITVYGKLDYYGFTGTISLIIDSILENEGCGELQKQYDQLKEDYQLKGYFDKDKKLNLPKYIKNILIITSQTGAAIQDFLFNLENNQSKIIYEIMDVPVQGYDSPKIIANKLFELKNINYDLIVITRGGGSFQDLFGFSNSELIEAVYNFKKIPIISAIGHQIDNPLLDLVADFSCPTPSLAAQCLVDINKNFISNLYNYRSNFKETILYELNKSQHKLSTFDSVIKRSFDEISTVLYNFKSCIQTEIQNKKIKLEYLLKSLDNPNIELYDLNQTKILDSQDIKKDNILIMRWNNQDFRIQIL
jgi:exodeoxyribonuclease VII large subunit